MIARDRPFFRGQELPRLLLLLAILAAGLVFFWNSLYSRDLPAVEAAPAVDGPPAPIVPDRDAAFETVADKTPISLRDMAAYALAAGARPRHPPGRAGPAGASRRRLHPPVGPSRALPRASPSTCSARRGPSCGTSRS